MGLFDSYLLQSDRDSLISAIKQVERQIEIIFKNDNFYLKEAQKLPFFANLLQFLLGRHLNTLEDGFNDSLLQRSS